MGTKRVAPINAPGLSGLHGCRSLGVAGSANVPPLPELVKSSIAPEPVENSAAPLLAPAVSGLNSVDTLPVGVTPPPTQWSPDPALRKPKCPHPKEHVVQVCQCSPLLTPLRVSFKLVLQE